MFILSPPKTKEEKIERELQWFRKQYFLLKKSYDYIYKNYQKSNDNIMKLQEVITYYDSIVQERDDSDIIYFTKHNILYGKLNKKIF